MMPLAISMFASIVSSVGVVGFTGHFYAYGFHFSWSVITAIILLPLITQVIIPVVYKLKVTSIFEYVRMRYGNCIAVMMSSVYILLVQSNGAITIFSASVAISTIFQVHILWGTVAIGLIGTFYTALGGLRGVVSTDCTQALLSILAPVTVIIK
ncbi:unnamed protein product, partial [Ixodes hexagonus]